ncbi:hypothetical protein ABOM_008893 [Aspergillus bombycis]|uniref:Uncharacterized protein n=1 Tax=Aspergillus bombycis TaxID=109264 RepID=A0A1F7ZPZ7_9EURO|nr:hypothetical protein ABOM_008893 [Aspergillus bombycis]OGM41523.1 hypothetical protein ABOM_008893 [Aspergillus bombycis]
MPIADLAVTTGTAGTAGSRPFVVRLDVPCLQYYCYPLELLQAGLVSWKYVQEWFRLVDRRHRQVAGLLRDTITHEAAWREFLDILDDCQRPKDLRNVALMAYVFEIKYPALHQIATKSLHGNGERSGRPRLIQVDDIAEWRIFDRAEKLLKPLKRFKDRQHGFDPLLVGVFPSPRIFTSEDQGRFTLFLHSPGLKILQTRSPSGNSEEGSCVVRPLDIIGQIYGREVQDNLNLCDQQ